MRTAGCLIICTLSVNASALAQDDFSYIKAKLGQQIVVTEDGLSVSGRLTELSAASMKVGDTEIAPRRGLKIERDNGNTTLRGLKFGAGIGAAVGFASSARYGLDSGIAGAVVAGLSGAFWGTLIGAAQDRRTTLYDTSAGAEQRDTDPQLHLPEPAPATAHAEFGHLGIKPGDLLFVTSGGVTLTGTVSVVEPTRLIVGTREFAPQPDMKIERHGDPIWDGAGAGFLLGALLGPTVGAEACLNRPMWHCVVEAGVELGAIGALIDYEHKGRTTIYDTTTSAPRVAVHVTPIVTRGERSVAVRVGF
jgi:hypothetical protein